ncbi:MAG TPA: EAL domain-containing protein, partial [Spirochaetota bacterium]|nr:EAL domain-containing protein [Spirochaetota bacterium]
IHDLGISISIDDFGVGFSSLSRLSHLKFDTLKIDKSFIDKILIDRNSQITVNSIITLAHNLNKTVVAEGVETIEQFNMLKELKCDIFQGYFFGKPMIFEEIEKLLIKQQKKKSPKS